MSPDIDIDGVTLESARLWLSGAFSVGDRLRDCRHLDFSRPEIVFANVLGNRSSYRAAVAAILALVERGARGLVAHACGPVMPERYVRLGGLVTMKEAIIWRGENMQAFRILMPEKQFFEWVKKVTAK